MKIPILIEAMSYVEDGLIDEADSFIPAPKKNADWKTSLKTIGTMAASVVIVFTVLLFTVEEFKTNTQLDRTGSIESDYESFYGVVLEIEEHSLLIEHYLPVYTDDVPRALYRVYTYDLDEDEIPYVEIGSFVRVTYLGKLYGDGIKVPELVTEIVSVEEYRKYFEWD